MACKRLGARLPSLLGSTAGPSSTAACSSVASGSRHSSSSSGVSASASSQRLPPGSLLRSSVGGSSASSTSSRRSFASSAPVFARKAVGSKSTQAAAPAAPEPEILLGELATNRLRDHYYNALADDLLYLNYTHRLAIDPDLPQANLSWLEKNPTNQFAPNQPHPRAPGARASLVPVRHSVNEYNVPRLEAIVVSTFVREAIARKSQLLPAIHALRTMTGQVKNADNDRTKAGVEIIVGKRGAATWHLRSGMPVGAKVTLRGPEMYRFMESLTEFVFPRIRDWPGIKMQQIGQRVDPVSGDETAGVVSFGFEPHVMQLFPQVEAALSVYNRLPGFNINFITNQRGVGAKWRARMLLSGFRFPFYSPEKTAKKRSKFSGKGGKKRR
jgi:large subunit ribosomal protein L5